MTSFSVDDCVMRIVNRGLFIFKFLLIACHSSPLTKLLHANLAPFLNLSGFNES